jgi:5,5'-dehydrodivanillate O-demethylase
MSSTRPPTDSRHTAGDYDDLVRTGPGTLAGRYLRSFWQPVYLAKDLKPGHAKPIRIMSEDLTLYRGEGGAPHLVAYRCAHRGTQLSTGWVEGDCIRCFYHGWKYDHTGQCVEMPAEDPSFPPKVRIRSYPAREYAGFIFAFLGDGTPPEFPRAPELERGYGVQWTDAQPWPCNWFQRLENQVDGVHVAFVHRAGLYGEAISSAVPQVEVEETPWGLRQTATRSADNVRINEWIWPNTLHVLAPVLPAPYPWADAFNWYVPIDDETSVRLGVFDMPVVGEAARQFEERRPREPYNPADDGDRLMNGLLRREDTNDVVQTQDFVAQVGQGRIVDRSQERLGRSDVGVILLRKVYRRELEAFGKGLPGKQWRPRPAGARLPVPPTVQQVPGLEQTVGR